MVRTKDNLRNKTRGRLGRLKDEAFATWRQITDARHEAERALAQTKEEARDVQDAMRARGPRGP